MPSDGSRLLHRTIGCGEIRVEDGDTVRKGDVLVRLDDAWPRRLVFCLPMRVLVEQTESEVRRWLERVNLLWRGPAEPRTGRVGVHRMMGGVDLDEWHLWPDEPAVLIGTQDMLLSRALNRGYGSPRARWPMEMAPPSTLSLSWGMPSLSRI